MLNVIKIEGNEKNSALIQCAGETAFTGKPVKKAGKVDWYHEGFKYEIKNGCSSVTSLVWSNSKKIKVLFVPVPKVTEYKGASYYDPYEQDGYILDKDTFIYILETCGLLRTEKKTTAYYRHDKPEQPANNGKDSTYKERFSMQTYYNRKENKPHGSKYFKMLDLLQELCIETLDEHIERLGL